MKIDRLLSIIVYLLNRDLVSARELAERYDVSMRTIQRDLETIDLAGIPILSVQGPRGGYGIMDTYKMDRQFVTVDDLFYIITSLSSIGTSLSNQKIESTIEKMKSLLPARDDEMFDDRHRKLFVDFSMLGGSSRDHEVLKLIEKAVDQDLLLKIHYTNTKLESMVRIVEPMTIAFKWRSWYLFAFCREKQDYRLFRLSRIRDPEIIPKQFRRREKSIDQFLEDSGGWISGKTVDLVLAFDRNMRPLVEEFFGGSDAIQEEDGRLIVHTSMPEDGWVYGLILSYGSMVEVLSPVRIRSIIHDIASKIQKIYE